MAKSTLMFSPTCSHPKKGSRQYPRHEGRHQAPEERKAEVNSPLEFSGSSINVCLVETEKYLLRALLGKDSTQGLLNRKKRDNGSSTVEGVGTSEGVKHNGRCRASQKTLSTV
ncbi:unnamed protein product [Ilex paraguariensis]|uniref:Uncharacterized protein n=1 Tax=Ilex paraguariensis TaxID=185542 RepID=A0ABC8UWS3_9AQUA